MQSAGSNSGDVLQDLHSKCHFAFRCQTALTKKQNHVKVDVSSGLQGWSSQDQNRYCSANSAYTVSADKEGAEADADTVRNKLQTKPNA